MLLSEIVEIQDAFMLLVSDKFYQDHYVDMDSIGFNSITKVDANKLLSKSRFSPLFNEMLNYSIQEGTSEDDICEMWRQHIAEDGNSKCSLVEAKCIIAYINHYFGSKTYKVSKRSMTFWYELFEGLAEKKIPEVKVDGVMIAYDTIIYDAKKIEIKDIDSVPGFLEYILMETKKEDGKKRFFRGHSLMNYLLIPSIMRKDENTGEYDLLKREQHLYNEIQYKCPEEFEK